MPGELPADALAELARSLDAGELQVLRDRWPGRREVRQSLTRYTDRVWLFPFGAAPDMEQPVRVMVNGIGQFMGEEVQLVPVGKQKLIVAVMWRPLGPPEVVAAVYVAKPREDA